MLANMFSRTGQLIKNLCNALVTMITLIICLTFFYGFYIFVAAPCSWRLGAEINVIYFNAGHVAILIHSVGASVFSTLTLSVSCNGQTPAGIWRKDNCQMGWVIRRHDVILCSCNLLQFKFDSSWVLPWLHFKVRKILTNAKTFLIPAAKFFSQRQGLGANDGKRVLTFLIQKI